MNNDPNATASMVWTWVKEQSRKIPYEGYKCLQWRVQDIIGEAEDNANDTVCIEKTVDESEWDQIALSTLEMSLCYCKDETVISWFRSIGFKW